MSEHCHHNPKIEVIERTAHGDIFRLLKPLPFNFKGKKFTVLKGFLSDGMSVPAFLWAIVSPRIDPRTLCGAIAHDYIYREQPDGWTRKDADKMLYAIIRADGLSWMRSQRVYWGVRLFGGVAWRENRKAIIREYLYRFLSSKERERLTSFATGVRRNVDSGRRKHTKQKF